MSARREQEDSRQPQRNCDHFSPVAAQYAAHRPRYPDALFTFLAKSTPAHAVAWDVGCGSGQASVGIAQHFERVVATDASAAQIEHAEPHARIVYSVTGEENDALAAGSVDLVTVAQALHWFDRPRFYVEVARVLKPSGVLAVWTYGLTTISPPIDAAISRWYAEALGPYWPPERRFVEAQYGGIDFPFPTRPVPQLAMTAEWTRDQVVAYLGTWSAVKEYRLREHGDALDLLLPDLLEAWPRNESRLIEWPLTLLMGGPQR